MHVWWEAFYEPPEVLLQNPYKYGDIERDRLTRFSVMFQGIGRVIDFMVPEGAGGLLVYRKRTSLSSAGGSAEVWHIAGIPGTYVAAVNESSLEKIEDIDFYQHPVLYRPVPHPHEGETWT